MADERGHKVRFEPLFSAGNVVSIVTTVLVGAGVIYGMQFDTRAHAQRIEQVEKKIEKGEARDDESARTLNDLKGAVIELRTEQKAGRAETDRQGRQLDRIEQLLQQRVQPGPAPHPAPPRAPSSIEVYPR